tara:strand:- start:655 stop:939 length:285 start_codon:yes stop_codon:yes gene_type:complete
MLHNLLFRGIITLVLLNIFIPLETRAEHKNNLINKFCIASIKSKLTNKDKQNIDEISNFTCGCFFEKYNSGSSIRNSRIHCKNKATEKYNLKEY